MKQGKKFISLLLAFVMIFSLSITAYAVEDYANVTGTVKEVQKYGNLTMDIEPKALYDADYKLGDMLKVTVGDTVLEIPLCTSYSDVDTGSLVVRDDQKNNLLVVAINMGNFSTTYNANVGDTVTFSMAEKEGYLAEYLIRQLKRTDVRSDYSTDSIFANFRSIVTTGINPAVLYRSSSPVNNELGRASFADNLTEAVGINTVINLADSEDEIKTYAALEGFASDYYISLYETGNVIALDMGVDISGQDFGKKLAEGLRFMSKNDGPYLIHCTEGKDRAGFASALLECLMGATLDEVVADYMTTYENYYKLEEGSEQYISVADSNIMASLTTVVCGLEKGSDISGVDLAAAADNYLGRIGMTSAEIKSLKSKLSTDSAYKTPNVSAIVTEIEKYGHASTDVLIENFYKVGFKTGDMVTAVFENGFVLEAPFLDGYYVDSGNPLVRAYPGHTNIAVCINYGKLNLVADVEVGDKVTIMLTGPEAYKVQYEIRKLERTNDRADYSSDEEFANFRNITTGNIAQDILYRSSSPVNNELGRASYSDNLIKSVNINTVINLADSAENIESYIKAEGFASPYYANLYKNNKVLPLNMGLAFASEEFKSSIVKGLVFMSENDGPYLFHCTEGKDRAGYFAALVEALMGSSKEEIVKDYMQSYINYYGVESGTDKYNLISQDVLSMLKVIAGTDDLEKSNLASAAESYLLSGGMTSEQITKLKKNLSTEIIVPNEPIIEKPVVTEPVVAEPTTETIYIVVSGDCLWNISKAHLGNGTRYMEIYNLNKDSIENPALISIGQKLVLPAK
ncbi:MAG: Peptidoglycan-binding lysin domain protein [Sedimentibacter sp.]|nr:Peptidoglycan-binding lysin domain protein [Sedimentibacter sp.]